METLTLILGVLLLVAAMRSHALAQANVIKNIKREWWERLFTGSRATRDNLTEEGLGHRKQSNYFAIGGFLMIGVYTLLKFSG